MPARRLLSTGRLNIFWVGVLAVAALVATLAMPVRVWRTGEPGSRSTGATAAP